MIRSKKIRDSAKGAECSLRLPDICQGGTETTVWAHLNGAAFGKGLGNKAHDIHGFSSCHSCHSAYDSHTHGLSDGEINRYLLEAVCESYLRLVQLGVVIVPQDIKCPSRSKPEKPRNAAAMGKKSRWPQGRKIQSRPFEKKAKP